MGTEARIRLVGDYNPTNELFDIRRNLRRAGGNGSAHMHTSGTATSNRRDSVLRAGAPRMFGVSEAPSRGIFGVAENHGLHTTSRKAGVSVEAFSVKLARSGRCPAAPDVSLSLPRGPCQALPTRPRLVTAGADRTAPLLKHRNIPPHASLARQLVDTARHHDVLDGNSVWLENRALFAAGSFS